MRKLTLSLLSVFMIVGCGKSQNPLDHLSEEYQNGRLPGQGSTGELTPNDFLQIDVEPALINFDEGREGVFKVTGRTVDLDSDVELQLNGLPDGAVYDPGTGEVTWTPPLDYISVDQVSEVVVVEAVLSTTQSPVVAISQSFNIWVHKITERPEIVSVQPVGFTDLKEDSIAEFRVRFKLREGNAARLGFVASANQKDLSAFVFQKGNPVLTTTADVWEVLVGVNTQGKELTESREDFHFGLIVYSPDGVQTQPYDVVVPVLNQVRRAASSWEYAQVFTNSEANKYSFQVYVPKANHMINPAGDLSINGFENACSAISSNLTCTCLRSSAQSFYCTVAGTPTAQDIGFHEIEFNSEVSNPLDPTDVERATHKAVLEIL